MSSFSLSMLRASYGVGAGLFGGWFSDEVTSLATIIVLLSVGIWL